MKVSRASIDTPALIVDLDVLDRNIATMAARAKAWGVALRPHAKTHKCSAIARRQVAAGAIGIACATIDEAEVMVEADLPGVLVTSPLATEHKVRRFTELLRRRSDLAVVADHPQHVALLAEMARRYSVAPSVLVDLDVGDHRTGTATLEAAVNLAQQIQDSSDLRFAGLQGYAGRIQHVAAFAKRNSEAAKVAGQLAELRDRLWALLLGVMPLLFVFYLCICTPTPELPQDQQFESLSPRTKGARPVENSLDSALRCA